MNGGRKQKNSFRKKQGGSAVRLRFDGPGLAHYLDLLLFDFDQLTIIIIIKYIRLDLERSGQRK